jgi:glycosyltransferase involved in cell wall biosynthesis
MQRAKNRDALAVAVLRLARNPELARELGRRGRDRIEREFSSRATIVRTAALYRELVAEGAHA